MAAEEERGEVRTVRQVGVWTVTKVTALMGLLWSVILAVPLIALSGTVAGVGAVSVGETAVLVVGAAFYGGFGGAVSAVIYNLAAEFAGGVAVRVE